MTETALEIRDLRVTYNSQRRRLVAVRSVSFEVPRGATVGIVGESGSGKSTVALSIMRLISPPVGQIESGSISVEGVDVLKLKRRDMRRVRRERIGYIPQDPSAALDPLCTIGRHVNETLSMSVPSADRKAAIVTLLESLGMAGAGGRLRSYPHEFSGGMVQRVAIATSLAKEPNLIIADEPTTALDATTQIGILRLLDALRRERGLSMLFVTHDLTVARVLCQYVVVMYAGEVVEVGSTNAVVESPQHPYTRALLGAVPQPGVAARARLPIIAGQPPRPKEKPIGCPFAPRCPLADARCGEEMPEMREVAGRRVACWRVNDSGGR